MTAAAASAALAAAAAQAAPIANPPQSAATSPGHAQQPPAGTPVPAQVSYFPQLAEPSPTSPSRTGATGDMTVSPTTADGRVLGGASSRLSRSPATLSASLFAARLGEGGSPPGSSLRRGRSVDSGASTPRARQSMERDGTRELTDTADGSSLASSKENERHMRWEGLRQKLDDMRREKDRHRKKSERLTAQLQRLKAKHDLVEEARKAGLTTTILADLVRAQRLLQKAFNEHKITKWQRNIIKSLLGHIIAGFGTGDGWLRPQHVSFDLWSAQVCQSTEARRAAFRCHNCTKPWLRAYRVRQVHEVFLPGHSGKIGEWPESVRAWISTMFANTQREATIRRYLNTENIKIPSESTCARWRAEYPARLAQLLEDLQKMAEAEGSQARPSTIASCTSGAASSSSSSPTPPPGQCCSS